MFGDEIPSAVWMDLRKFFVKLMNNHRKGSLSQEPGSEVTRGGNGTVTET